MGLMQTLSTMWPRLKSEKRANRVSPALRACECFEVPLWLSVMLVMGVRRWELTELRVS